MSNCDNCKNSGICKYEDDARDFEDYVTGAKTNDDTKLKRPSVITAYVRCNRFVSNINLKKIKDEMAGGKSAEDIAKEFNISKGKVHALTKK